MFNSLYLACLVWGTSVLQAATHRVTLFFAKFAATGNAVRPVQCRDVFTLCLGFIVFFLAWIGIIPFGVKIIFSVGFY